MQTPLINRSSITMEQPQVRSMSIKELAALYGVSQCTFKNWIRLYKDEIGKKVGWFYKPAQVKTILKVLGDPQ